MPGDRSLYDIIRDRIEPAHSAVGENTSRNLLKWATKDPGGPKFPHARAMLRRKILARLGFSRTRSGRIVVAARRKPYVSTRGKAYCERRSHRWLGQSARRPRVFLDASLINKLRRLIHVGAIWRARPDRSRRQKRRRRRWAILHSLAYWWGGLVEKTEGRRSSGARY